jgi:RNA polymerase sigma factor (sigma-70 family)
MDDSPGILTSVSLLNGLRDHTNGKARSEFALRYRSWILSICRRFLPQEADAEDATTFILLRFFEKDRFRTYRYEPPVRFRGWLRKVVANDLCDFLKQRQRELPVPAERWIGDPQTLEALEDGRGSEALAAELWQLFYRDSARGQKALEIVGKRVEPKTVAIFRAMVMEGASGVQLAEELSMQPEAVYQARRRVANMLLKIYRQLEASENGEAR